MDKIFDHYIVVDWSAKDEPGPSHRKPDRQKKDNIWIGEGPEGATEHYFRTRSRAATFLQQRIETLVKADKRVFVGFDFAFGYPAGFAEALTGKAGWASLWKFISKHATDDELNENNRFELAASMNSVFPENGPFWGTPKDFESEGLSAKSPWKGVNELKFAGKTIQRMRHTDAATKGTQEVWQLYGAGSVGGQTLTGIPVVWNLRQSEALKAHSKIWPLETTLSKKAHFDKKVKVIFSEIFPTIANDRVRELSKTEKEAPKDQLQVRALVEKLAAADKESELFTWFFAATDMPAEVLSEEAAILQPPAPVSTSSVKNNDEEKQQREEEKAKRKAEREAKRAERERVRAEKRLAKAAKKSDAPKEKAVKKEKTTSVKAKTTKSKAKAKSKADKEPRVPRKHKVKTPEGKTIEVTESMKGFDTQTPPDPAILDQLMKKEEE